jgi:hypothetical protein
MVGTFLVTAGLVVGLVVLGFAIVGIAGVVMALGDWTSEQSRVEREARLAEQHIADIGRRAQEAIVVEALRRLRERRQ